MIPFVLVPAILLLYSCSTRHWGTARSDDTSSLPGDPKWGGSHVRLRHFFSWNFRSQRHLVAQRHVSTTNRREVQHQQSWANYLQFLRGSGRELHVRRRQFRWDRIVQRGGIADSLWVKSRSTIIELLLLWLGHAFLILTMMKIPGVGIRRWPPVESGLPMVATSIHYSLVVDMQS